MSIEVYLLADFVLVGAILMLTSKCTGFFSPAKIMIASFFSALGAAAVETGFVPKNPGIALMLIFVSILLVSAGKHKRFIVRGILWCLLWTIVAVGIQISAQIWFDFYGIKNMALTSGILTVFAIISPELIAEHFENTTVQLCITTRVGTVHLCAFIDNGNQLREPLSGLPVLIVNESCLSKVIDQNCLRLENLPWPGFRVLTYDCLGSSGTMICFKPERIMILKRRAWRITPDMWVAVYHGTIPQGWDAIAPSSIQI